MTNKHKNMSDKYTELLTLNNLEETENLDENTAYSSKLLLL